MCPGWLNDGVCWGALGRVSQYVPGAAISSLIKKGWGEHLLWHLCSEQPFLLIWPGACANFPTKTNHGIIRALCGDVPMMYRILDDDIYISIEKV